MEMTEVWHWHIIWTTFLSWPPHDRRGDWSRLSEVYGPLVADGRVTLCPQGLPNSWQQKSPPNGQVQLSPAFASRVQRDLLALAAPHGDRIVHGLPIAALAVTTTAVQLVTAAPEKALEQAVGRLKSKLSWHKNTWGRGFWYARLLDEQARQTIEAFVQSCDVQFGVSNMKPGDSEPAPAEAERTELHSAAYYGDLDGVLVALGQGLDVNGQDQGGWTPLHWVVDMGMVAGEREQIIAALIQAGADVNARSADGSTPLMVACRAGNGDLVRQLVAAGANLHACNDKGWTALIEAAYYGNPQTVAFLLDSGADKSARTLDGKTALDLAQLQLWDEVVQVLSE